MLGCTCHQQFTQVMPPTPPMKTLIALTAGLVVASSLATQGQSVTWNLGGNADGKSSTVGYGLSSGETLSFTNSGVKVTA
ncbi:MAG: hypothetical protein RLZZ505_2655, partial [Verrucomicrobiota bacterium]